MLIMIHRC